MNPYVTIIGPLESAAKRMSIMGICNKVAGVLGPIALASIVLKDADAFVQGLALLDPTQSRWSWMVSRRVRSCPTA